MVDKGKELLDERFKSDRYNVGINVGVDAGQNCYALPSDSVSDSSITGPVALSLTRSTIAAYERLGMHVTDESPGCFTVLIVEDHPEQRGLLELILQKEGYRVLSAGNGLEAWEKLEKDDAQLVLLDIMLPEMDGFELLRRIRHSERLKDIFVIIVSARARERDIVQGLDLGADDYIIKPFSFHVLLARIRVGVRRMTPRS